MSLLTSIKERFESPHQRYQKFMLEAPGYYHDGVTFGMDGRGTPYGKPMGMDGHILIVGGAGSGKSSCIAIPTLKYGWKAPALVVDIKGELYSKSSRPYAYVFNPMSRSALGYDPFSPLHNSHHPASDVEGIAQMLVPHSPGAKDDLWTLSAQNVLAAHLLYSFKRGATFLQALYTLQGTDPTITLEIEEEDDEECRLFLMHVSRSEKTLSSVMQTLSNHIRPFVTDEYLKDTLSRKNVITPELLERGYDIFLQLPPYKLDQWRGLISLIVQQFCRHFERRPEGSSRQTLFMLDEFPRLGKMPQVVDGLATLRSKNVTMMVIVQSLAQLDVTYGQDQRKVICDNCDFKAILKATDAETQRYFSQIFGTEEREKVTYTSGEKSSTSRSTEERPRIKPEEFAYLHQELVLLCPRGTGRLQKVPYWQIS